MLGERHALAQEQADAPPITRNDYALELYQGPLLAPIRITGLAGATTATADSVEGVYANAGSPAVREPFSFRWFEFDVSASIAFPGAYGGTDFNNRGEKGIERNIARGRRATVETTDRFLYLQGGIWGQFGDLGITVTADQLRYDVGSQGAAAPSLELAITRLHAVAGYAFFDNQLCIGGGARAVYVNVDEVSSSAGDVISMLGAAPEVGAVIKPSELPWRIGVTGRMSVEAKPFSLGRIVEQRVGGDTVKRAGSFVLPDRIRQPWEIEMGVAYQFGPRPLNPVWINPRDHESEIRAELAKRREERRRERRSEIEMLPRSTPEERAILRRRLDELRIVEQVERERDERELAEEQERLYQERKARYLNWPRERVLFLASLLVTGASQDAVALDGFIDQRRELVGRSLSIAPRVAIESEPLPNHLTFRVGTYFEPSRFEDGTTREHFTFGSDVKLFPWDVFGILPDQVWRLSAFLDVAARYSSFGFGVGTWH